MTARTEIGLFLTDLLREVGRQAKEKYVEDAVEDERYSDAEYATVAQAIFDGALSLAEIRLKKMAQEED